LVFTKENPMRALWLPLTLLLASSSWAADKTVLIPLHHVSAGEVERSLTRGALRSGVVGTPIEQEGASLIPPGVTAWTVDERRNGLQVTGSEEGIRSLTQIIDLIDVPARRVRLSLRVVRLDAPDLAWLKAEPLPDSLLGRQSAGFVVLPTGGQLAFLEAHEALAAADMNVASNLPLHLAWPGNLNQPPAPTDVIPRVNGDGTVTLFFPRTGLSSAPLAGGGATLVTRRVEPGRTVVIFSRTLGTALVIKVSEVLPAGG
jgi:hypothetical protein